MKLLKYLFLCISAYLHASALEPHELLTQHRQYICQAEACIKGNKKKEALQEYKKALELDPNDFNTLYAAANVCRDLELCHEAAALYSQAMALDPKNVQLILDAANMFNIIDELDITLQLYKKILHLCPGALEVLYNYGYTLKKKGQINQAIEIYQKILALRADYAHPHFSLALAYLSLGKFEQGWKEYEWRWKAYDEEPKKFDRPLWQGQDLSGKTIFLYAEQGLGDTFQFIRYAKCIKSMGARILFHAQTPLKKMLGLCPYLDKVIIAGEPIPHFDYYLPLMSCPLIFGTTLDSVPQEIPYLFADETLVKRWKEILSADPNFKIGICWQGNGNYNTIFLRKAVAAKSMHVRSFMPLIQIPGISLYSLQKINGIEQLLDLQDLSIKTFDATFDEQNGRFMDTGAVIKNLDLVITIDTSIGHLAAALGTPTWILLPNPADWRWMIDREDSPWYENVRLFRQKKSGDWQAVISEVAQALQKELACKT